MSSCSFCSSCSSILFRVLIGKQVLPQDSYQASLIYLCSSGCLSEPERHRHTAKHTEASTYSSIYLSIHLSVCLFICMSTCLSLTVSWLLSHYYTCICAMLRLEELTIVPSKTDNSTQALHTFNLRHVEDMQHTQAQTLRAAQARAPNN